MASVSWAMRWELVGYAQETNAPMSPGDQPGSHLPGGRELVDPDRRQRRQRIGGPDADHREVELCALWRLGHHLAERRRQQDRLRTTLAQCGDLLPALRHVAWKLALGYENEEVPIVQRVRHLDDGVEGLVNGLNDHPLRRVIKHQTAFEAKKIRTETTSRVRSP